jgi:hypothetical protein
MHRLFLTALALSVATGCSPVKIEGDLDGGGGVKFSEAIFVEITAANLTYIRGFEPEQGIAVFVTEYKDTCATLTAYYDGLEEAIEAQHAGAVEGAEDREAAEATLPEDHWVGLFNFAVEDMTTLGGPFASGVFEGTTTEDSELHSGEFEAQLVHNTGYTDWSTCMETDYAECDQKWEEFSSEGGTATVNEFATQDSLEFEFSADFKTVVDDRVVNTVEGSVTATWCEDLENFMTAEEEEAGE